MRRPPRRRADDRLRDRRLARYVNFDLAIGEERDLHRRRLRPLELVNAAPGDAEPSRIAEGEHLPAGGRIEIGKQRREAWRPDEESRHRPRGTRRVGFREREIAVGIDEDPIVLLVEEGEPERQHHLAGIVIGQRQRLAERLPETIRRLFGVVSAVDVRPESHRHVRKVERVGPRHQIARILQHRDLSAVLRHRLDRRDSSRPPRDGHAVLPQSVEMPPARIGIETSRLDDGGGLKSAAGDCCPSPWRQRPRRTDR